MNTQQNLVTQKDIAAKLNIPINTVYTYLRPGYNGPETKTVKRVREAAAEMGYDPRAVAKAKCVKMNELKTKAKRPANKVFASREEETKAMTDLRAQGYSNAEIGQKCGVHYATVLSRIGLEPANITSANRKLGHKIRSAKIKMRMRLANEAKLLEYNQKVAAFNAEAAKLLQQYSQLKQLEKSAQKMAASIKLKAAAPTKLM